MSSETGNIEDQAAERLFGTMRDHILDFIKQDGAGAPWNERKEDEQLRVIERTERFCRDEIRRVVTTISAAGRKVIAGRLESLAVKDGIKAVVKVAASDSLRHELMDAQGRDILLVVCDADEFMGGDPVPVSPDQNEMFSNADFEEGEPPVFDQTAMAENMEAPLDDPKPQRSRRKKETV